MDSKQLKMPPEPKGLFQSMGNFDDFKTWLRGHKLQALGTAWATAVGASFASQWTSNTPLALKFFQTRIYAQAFTIAALVGAAAIAATDETPQEKEDDILPGHR